MGAIIRRTSIATRQEFGKATTGSIKHAMRRQVPARHWRRHLHCRCKGLSEIMVVIPGVWRPFGKRIGRASGQPYPLRLIWTGQGTEAKKLLFQIYFIALTFLIIFRWCGHVVDGSLRWLPTEVCHHPFDPSNLPWAVSQCPFDPFWAGIKVYQADLVGRWAVQVGNPSHKQPCLRWVAMATPFRRSPELSLS